MPILVNQEYNLICMRKKLLFALAIIVLNIFLLEAGTRLLAVHAKPTLGKTASFDRKFQLAAKKHEDVPEILMLGDSLMYFTLYPELMDILLSKNLSTPVNSLNLASPSTTPEMNLLLLKQVVAHSGKPRLVLYNFSPRIFNGNKPQDEYDLAFQRSYYRRCYDEHPQTGLDSVRCFMEKNFALARYRDFLKSEMEKMPRTLFMFNERLEFPSSNKSELEISDKGWAPAYQIRGTGEIRAEYDNNPEVESTFKKELGNYQWSTKAFQPLLTYCEKHKIPVVIIWFPENELMARYYRQIGLSEAMLANKLQNMADDHSIYFLNLRNQNLRDIEFSDLDHLNPLGAVEVTKTMAHLLSQLPYRYFFASKGKRS